MEKQIIKKRVNKVIYISGDLCYKTFEPSYDVALILNEATNQARVQKTGLNIPKFVAVTSIDNQFAIVMQAIEGKNLEVLMNEHPEKEDEYLKRFVDIQVDMQNKKCPLLANHHDKMNFKIANTDLSSTLRYDLHKRIESTPKNNYLCHGDYNPSNVIIDKNDVAYIIDWSHATQGNREADSARTFLLFLLEGKNELAKKYLKVYCEASGCNYLDVLYWLPILSASQSVKGIVEQSELLTKLIYSNKKGLIELYEEI